MSAIPVGYKQTEVGVIPEDWNCSSVAQIASSTSNSIVGGPFGSDLVSNDYVPTGVPVVRGQNMGGSYVAGDFVFVSTLKAKKLQANTARADDIVFTQRGTLGQVSIVPSKPFGEYVISQSQMKLTLNRAVADTQYIYQYFSGVEGQKQITQSAIQTGVPHTNLGILKAYRVPLPSSVVEQRAIAAALSDVDALLAKLDQLIAKKRDLKQAAMQQLLTGQTRLPGFSGEWEVKRLGDVLEKIVGGGTPSRSNANYWGGEIPWVTVKDFATFSPIAAQETITQDGLKNSASNLIPSGTLITSTRMALGKAVIYEVDVSINQDLKSLFPKINVSTKFLYYWFESNATAIDELGSGSTVKGISLGDLKAITFLLSSLEEQTAIATVLSDMDAELTALETRRDKTRALKQGMMQELLTGRIRLV